MDEVVHLEVVSGPEAGRQITVPPAGAQLGRSRRNDIVLDDDRLSRHHCRFYFKDGHLFVKDLDSANQTTVNERPIQDVRLTVGDLAAVGKTTLKVVHDGEKAALRLRALKPPAPPSSSGATIPPSADVHSRVEAVMDGGRPLSRFVTGPAWMLMILWWLFLAYSLLSPATRSKKDEPDDSAGSPAAATVTAARPLPTSPEGMTERLAELGVTAEQLGQLNMLKGLVADSLTSEDYAKALELLAIASKLQSNKTERDAMLKLGRFVQNISRVDSVIADNFVERIGAELVLQHGDRSLRFVPKAVAGDQVSGKYLSPSGERVVTFKVSSLSPAERSRWLGEATTPERCAMQCILKMQAGDYATARVFATNAGPLADELMKKAVGPPDS